MAAGRRRSRDADVAVGLIDPQLFAEGRLTLNRTLAAEALATDIAEPLGLPTEAGAYGVSQVVDENMANAARIHAMERGASYGGRTMIAFGGNGPLHAARLSTKLGVGTIIVPVDPGVGSAVGFLYAPVAYETVRSLTTLLSTLDLDLVNDLLATMEREAHGVVVEGAPAEPRYVRRTAFMRYHGQGHEIEVPVANGLLGEAELEALRSAYETQYARMYARHVPDMEIEILNWAVLVSTHRADLIVPSVVDSDRRPDPSGTRSIYVGETATDLAVPSFHRDDLQPGDHISGPAVIAEAQTTTFLSPDFDLRVDGVRNLVLTRRPV